MSTSLLGVPRREKVAGDRRGKGVKKPSSWLFYWHSVGDVGSGAALGREGGVGVG